MSPAMHSVQISIVNCNLCDKSYFGESKMKDNDNLIIAMKIYKIMFCSRTLASSLLNIFRNILPMLEIVLVKSYPNVSIFFYFLLYFHLCEIILRSCYNLFNWIPIFNRFIIFCLFLTDLKNIISHFKYFPARHLGT